MKGVLYLTDEEMFERALKEYNEDPEVVAEANQQFSSTDDDSSNYEGGDQSTGLNKLTSQWFGLKVVNQ
jgi:hypothetical protein